MPEVVIAPNCSQTPEFGECGGLADWRTIVSQSRMARDSIGNGNIDVLLRIWVFSSQDAPPNPIICNWNAVADWRTIGGPPVRQSATLPGWHPNLRSQPRGDLRHSRPKLVFTWHHPRRFWGVGSDSFYPSHSTTSEWSYSEP